MSTWLDVLRYPVTAFLSSTTAPLLLFIDEAWPNMYWNTGYILFVLWMYLFHAPFRVHSRARTDWYAQVTKVMQAWVGITATLFHLAPKYLEKQYRGVQNPGALFFPEFACFVVLLLLLHRYKRAMGLRITYAATTVSFFLNGILLSLLSTVHYAYCAHEEEQGSLVHVPGSTDANRNFVSMLREISAAPEWVLEGISTCIHVFLSFNRVFWAAVCPPRTFEEAPVLVIGHLFLCGVLFVVGDYVYKKSQGFDSVRGILWCEFVVPTLRERSTSLQSTAAEGGLGKDRSSAHGVSRGADNCRRHVGRRPVGESAGEPGTDVEALAASFSSSSEASAPALRGAAKRERGGGGGGGALSPMSLRSSAAATVATPVAIRRRRDMRTQPENPPAMVPWYSTLIAQTAFQLFIGNNLDFLSFDFRGLEPLIGPKSYRIVATKKPYVPPLQSGTTPHIKKQRPSSPHDAQGTQGNEIFPPTIPVDVVADELWFDWTADVGDGFNSTYEIARLLAQPQLAVLARTQLVRRFLAERARLGIVAAMNSVRRGGQTLGRTLRDSFSSLNLDSLLVDSGAAAPVQGGGLRRRSASAEHRQRVDTPTSGAAMASASADRPAISGVTSHTTDALHGASAPSSTLNLPRGSFLLVGGDLAYPSPTEESYQERLFTPYRDAMVPCTALRAAMHAERRSLRRKETERATGDDVTAVTTLHVLATEAAIKFLDIGAEVPSVETPAKRGEREGEDSEEAANGGLRRQAVLQSTPLVFAMPGNHDWIDGLATYRANILGKSWLGGWFMPQKSSYFALELPANWHFLCLDTGLFEDIDIEQCGYFMNYVDERMDAASCVVLATHEPHWVLDSLRHANNPEAVLKSEKLVQKLCRKIGRRLRMRIAGDLHHYSRHVPTDHRSDAPTLVVSGGGGAFLHGPRTAPVVHHGHAYTRQSAFPAKQTVLTIFTRLFGFRIVNWQFDFIGGLLYFAIVFSALPLPLTDGASGKPLLPEVHNPIDLLLAIANVSFSVLSYIVLESHISATVCVFGCLAMMSIMETKMHWYKRIPFALGWAVLHIVAAVVLLALMHCLMSYVVQSKMVESTRTTWASRMEMTLNSTLRELYQHSVAVVQSLLLPPSYVSADDSSMLEYPGGSPVSSDSDSGAVLHALYSVWSLVIRLLDVLEGMTFLALSTVGPRIGSFREDATRPEILWYYLHAGWFYWILATPVVSFLVGAFLLVSVTFTDTCYDPAYSAFQIEDFKHFIRFRLNRKSRELHCFVVGVDRVPKVWERDPCHDREGRLPAESTTAVEGRSPSQHPRQQSSSPVEEQRTRRTSPDSAYSWAEDAAASSLPSHLKKFPSVWRPRESLWRIPGDQGYAGPKLLDEFVIRPHRPG